MPDIYSPEPMDLDNLQLRVRCDLCGELFGPFDALYKAQRHDSCPACRRVVIERIRRKEVKR